MTLAMKHGRAESRCLVFSAHGLDDVAREGAILRAARIVLLDAAPA